MFALPLADDAELRPLEPWQAEEFFAHIERARAHTDPWIPWASRSTTLDAARATLQGYADRHAQDAGRIFGIWDRGTLVGGVMFVRFEIDAGTAEIGVWSEPAGSGRGLITRAVRVLVDYALGTRGLHRIEWHNSPTNLASRAVAQRLGMTLDGVLRAAYPYAGVRHDQEIWSLLAPEWAAQHSADSPRTSLGEPRARAL